MENKEEMIEDLDVVETVSEETIKFEPITEPANEEVTPSITEEEQVNYDSAEEKSAAEQLKEFEAKHGKTKSKVPLIVFLSILLVLDVAALVIYIIGIDKVLGFIR